MKWNPRDNHLSYSSFVYSFGIIINEVKAAHKRMRSYRILFQTLVFILGIIIEINEKSNRNKSTREEIIGEILNHLQIRAFERTFLLFLFSINLFLVSNDWFIHEYNFLMINNLYKDL